MRRVKIRDLRKNLKHHLSDLPFVVTNWGKDVAIVKEIKRDDYLRVGEAPSKGTQGSKKKKRVFSKIMGKYVKV